MKFEQAKELRVGNLLHLPYSNEYVEVLGINAHENQTPKINDLPKIYNSISFKKDSSLYCEPILLLDAIPLTEEWLLNFGYTKEDSNFWNLGHIVWEYDGGVFICDKNGITLKYVHQLQNLYFALTGRELTIKTEE